LIPTIDHLLLLKYFIKSMFFYFPVSSQSTPYNTMFLSFLTQQRCHIVNVTGAAVTYMRFLPTIKKNYDYGVMIFILTFSLILVSNYRIDDTTRMARDRFYTIVIGCGICLFLSLLIFPTWSGDDLHKSTIAKLEGLAQSVEGMISIF